MRIILKKFISIFIFGILILGILNVANANGTASYAYALAIAIAPPKFEKITAAGGVVTDIVEAILKLKKTTCSETTAITTSEIEQSSTGSSSCKSTSIVLPIITHEIEECVLKAEALFISEFENTAPEILARQSCSSINERIASYVNEQIAQQELEKLQLQNPQQPASDLYDEYGIVKAVQNDQAYYAYFNVLREKTDAEKKIINENLLVRHHLKNKMHELWDIPQTINEHLNQAIYQVVGDDGSVVADISILQKRIERVMKRAIDLQYMDHAKTFYLSNGVLKEYALHLPEAKDIKIPKKILSGGYNIIRYKFNKLLCAQIKNPEKAAQVQETIKHLERWLSSDDYQEIHDERRAWDQGYETVIKPRVKVDNFHGKYYPPYKPPESCFKNRPSITIIPSPKTSWYKNVSSISKIVALGGLAATTLGAIIKLAKQSLQNWKATRKQNISPQIETTKKVTSTSGSVFPRVLLCCILFGLILNQPPS